MVLLTANPINVQVVDDMKVFFGKPVQIMVSTSVKIQDAINKVYEKSTAHLNGLDEIEEEDYDLDEPIIDLLESGDDDAL